MNKCDTCGRPVPDLPDYVQTNPMVRVRCMACADAERPVSVPLNARGELEGTPYMSLTEKGARRPGRPRKVNAKAIAKAVAPDGGATAFRDAAAQTKVRVRRMAAPTADAGPLSEELNQLLLSH